MMFPFLVAGLGMEWWLRPQVPRNSVTPFQTSTVDGLPHEMRPNFQTLYKGATVQINEHGFRGDLPPRKESTWRVAIIGDSVTFGNAIGEADTLPVLLQERLPNAQFLNCGIPGFNAENVRQLLEQRVLAFEPDAVVYVFVSNDINRSAPQREIPADSVIDSFHGFPMGSAFLQWTGVRLKGLLRAIGDKNSGQWVQSTLKEFESGGKQRLRQSLIEMKQLCDERQIDFVTVSYPFLIRPSNNPFAPIEEAAEELCGRLEIPFWNLVNAFEPDEDLTRRWANPFDSHPSRGANELAADYLIAEVLEKKLAAFEGGRPQSE